MSGILAHPYDHVGGVADTVDYLIDDVIALADILSCAMAGDNSSDITYLSSASRTAWLIQRQMTAVKKLLDGKYGNRLHAVEDMWEIPG